MATSVGRSVAGRTIGRRGVNQSDGRSIGRLVESVRRSVGPTITHCPQLTIRYRYPLIEPLSKTSFSCSYPRSLSFLPSFLSSYSSSSPHSLFTTYHITFHSLHTTYCPTNSLLIAPLLFTPQNPLTTIHHPASTTYTFCLLKYTHHLLFTTYCAGFITCHRRPRKNLSAPSVPPFAARPRRERQRQVKRQRKIFYFYCLFCLV